MTWLLVLRPEPGASSTVEKARALGLDAVAVPLFEIDPVEWQTPDPGKFDGLLLTSANAVRYAGDQLRELSSLKVYAVGEASAKAAHDAGFDVAATGKLGVDRLLSSIAGDLKLLHLCGAGRREPERPRQCLTPLVVYRSRPIEASGVPSASGGVALVHSPAAGRRFAQLVEDRSAVTIAAISPAAANAVGGGWKTVEAAAEPSDEALLALAARLCNNPPPK
jgi:uroporphyrinogen-III synthase